MLKAISKFRTFIRMENQMFLRFKSSKVEECIPIDGSSLSLTYNKRSKALLVCNNFMRNIGVYNFSSELKLTQLVTLDSYFIKWPMVLCMNRKRNEIYVVCEKNEGALVLNADDFKLIRKFGEGTIYENVDFAAIDDVSEDNCFLYTFSGQNSKLAKWSCDKGELIKEISIPGILNISVKNENLFTICNNDDFQGVLAFDKNSFEIVKKITQTYLFLESIIFDFYA